MRPVNIPIRSAAPAPDDEPFEYLAMPEHIDRFSMPRPPEPGPGTEAADVAAARDVVAAFADALSLALDAGGELPAVDLAGLPSGTLRVLNEALGQGDVSAQAAAPHELRVQETAFPGIWREQHIEGTRLLHDWLLAAPIPAVIAAVAAERAAPALRERPLPVGAMNVPSLVAELKEAMGRSGPGTPAHVVNLTLLPLSPEDISHLDALLEGGSVVVLSRGFGSCRIASTAARHVWRVQYYNDAQSLILDTIEVVPMPEVAVAAQEDLLETRDRFADLVRWMNETVERDGAAAAG